MYVCKQVFVSPLLCIVMIFCSEIKSIPCKCLLRFHIFVNDLKNRFFKRKESTAAAPAAAHLSDREMDEALEGRMADFSRYQADIPMKEENEGKTAKQRTKR